MRVKIPVYPFEVRELTKEEGGGFLVSFPDLPGCLADGKSLGLAVTNAADAEIAWIRACENWGDAIPESSHTEHPRLTLPLSTTVQDDLFYTASILGVSPADLGMALIRKGLAAIDLEK